MSTSNIKNNYIDDGSFHSKDCTDNSSSNSASTSKKPVSNLVVRCISGVLYAGIFIGVLLLGPFATACFASFTAFLGCFEFYRMMRIGGKVPNEAIGLVAASIFPLAAYVHALAPTAVLFLTIAVLGLWFLASPRTRIEDVSITLLGPLYTGFLLSSLVFLRESVPGTPGAIFTILAVASVWMSDSFAYLVGSKIGKHKMVPKISPKKSWEGFIAGSVACIIVWIIIWSLKLTALSFAFAFLCGITVAVFGFIGDLIESRIKHGVGVKDSGDIIPGHGGILDRTDSLLFACLAVFFVLKVGGIL